MQDTLRADIDAQAENLRQVIDHLYGPERDNLETAAAAIDANKPIVFIGMASAAYLCKVAEFYLGQRGRLASTVSGSDAYHSLLYSLQGANVIINSRSGETVEIVQVSQALKAANVPFIAITNDRESTLVQLATHVVWSNTRPDDLVSINIVSGMLLTTLVLASFICGESESVHSGLLQLPDKLQHIIDQSWAQAEALSDFFASTRPIYLLSRGTSAGTALCARLVLEEVARTPAIALDAAEFRQGPIEVLDAEFGAIVFVSGDRAGKLNRSLGADILDKGGHVLFVGDNEEHPHPRAMTMPLHDLPDYLRPILEIVPAQILAYKLAERQGYHPGTVRYLSKVIVTEEGIPGESR